MAGASILFGASPSSATAAVGGRSGTTSKGSARSEYGKVSNLIQPVSQSSCCTSSYIQMRDRGRALQLNMASQHALNSVRSSSCARSTMACGGMSERIASSQFCSCSGVDSSCASTFQTALHEAARFGRHGGISKGRFRRKAGDEARHFLFSGSTMDSWDCRRRGRIYWGVPRGEHPRSENLDVEELKLDSGPQTAEDEASVLEGLELAPGPNTIAGISGEQPEDVTASQALALSQGPFELPKRWVIVILCFFAFLLCNMDRVNMSIAILPMSAEFHWSPTIVGLVQSSFFWGYLLTQIAGGVWADRIGGKQVLGFGVIWWSLATIATPIAAKIGLPALFFVRACMGIGEGVAMPAMNNLLSRWIPVEERSRSLALVYSGMYLGSVIGLACSPSLIHTFGWPSVFFSFGSVGAVWFFVWERLAYSSPSEDPGISADEKKMILKSNKARDPLATIPWALILSKAPVWALIICHFCHNWGTFILLTWMPTYYNQVLGFNLMESGLFSVLPWLTMAFSANLGGWIADTLVSKGYSVTLVRKVMQSIGFLGPAFFLTQLSHITSPSLAVLCMMCSQGLDAFSQAGLYSNHQDIGPRYAGILLGLSNTAGVLAGVLGTAATGYILQHGSWDDVFKVAVGLYLFGTVVWNVFATGEKQFD